MKTMLSFDACAIVVLLGSASAAFVRPASDEKAPSTHDHLSGAFRDDTTLKFMRRLRVPRDAHITLKASEADHQPGFGAVKETKLAAKERRASPFDEVEKGFKEAQKGPEHDSKEARVAAAKVADKHKATAPADKASTAEHPLDKLVDHAVDSADEAAAGEGSGSKEAAPEETPETPEPEPEEKEVPSVPGCRNSPKGWTDAKGKDCEDYAEGEWCTRHGGYGDAWLDEWGTFEDVARKGKSAKEVCCVCGGGLRKEDKDKVEKKPARRPAKAASSAAPAPAIKGPILGSKSGRALQEQGYSGELVNHEDQKTMTEDWGLEFGPHAGHRDIQTICNEHKNNEWCSLHGYYDKRSAAASQMPLVAAVVALLLACLR